MYSTFNELQAAYLKGEATFDEYRRYFSKLLSTNNPGYPDFTREYFKAMNASIERDLKAHPVSVAKKSNPRWVVIRADCNEYGDIVSVKEAYVFPTGKEAMSCVNKAQVANRGTFVNATTMFSKDSLEVYKLVKESKPCPA